MKFLVVILFSFSIINSYAMQEKWIIDSAVVFNKKTKKILNVNPRLGYAFLDFTNHIFTFPYEVHQGLFNFNHVEGYLTEDGLSYYFRDKSFSNTTNKSIHLTLSIPSQESNNNARIYITTNSTTTTIYIRRLAFEPIDREYLTQIKSGLDDIRFDWIYIGDTNEGNNLFLFSTPAKNQTADGITLWVKEEMLTYKHKNIVYRKAVCKSMMRFDCSSNRILVAENHYYTEKGNLIKSDDGSEWGNVIPETVGETLLKKACLHFRN